MPPKAAEQPIIDFDSPEYDGIEGDRVAALAAGLDHIVSLAEDGISQVQARQQVLDDVVDSAIEAALTAVDILYVARDEVAVTPVSLAHGSWEPEPAPAPCAVDTWLRAAIPESQVSKPSYALDRFLKGAPSMSRTGSRRGTHTGSSGSPGLPQARADVASPSMRRKSPLRAQSPVRPTRTLTPDEAAAENRLREELEIRRAQLAAAAGLDAKDAEAKAALAKLSKELKGKDYAYDHQGRVVPLTSFSSERAPGLQAGVDFRVKTPDTGAPVPRRGGMGKSPTRRGGKADDGQKKGPGDYREAPPKTQPSAMETLAPQAGVTLRAGASSKAGPRRPAVGTGMSKAEFAQYTAKKLAAQHESRMGPNAGPGIQAHAAAGAAVGVGGGGSPRPAPLGVSFSGSLGRGGAAAASPASAPSPPQELEEHQTPSTRYNPLDGLPDAVSITAGATLRGSGVLEPLAPKPPTPDVNAALVNAPDWGRSTGTARGYAGHAALPAAKPSAHMREAEVGRTMRLPRDRASQATASPPVSPSKIAALVQPLPPSSQHTTTRVK